MKKFYKIILCFILIFSSLGYIYQTSILTYTKAAETSTVELGGIPFGLKMYTSGVIVVGTADVDINNEKVNIAEEAGIQIGDIVESVNGKNVNTNNEVYEEIQKSNGNVVRLKLKRDDKEYTAAITPVKFKDIFRAGLWVRDSAAGIGTLTFCDNTGKYFAGLGHAVCDPETEQEIPLLKGDIVPVTINGVSKGKTGTPGELKGYFSSDIPIGKLEGNNQLGVYGKSYYTFEGEKIQVEKADMVHAGDVQIYCTIDGENPKLYNARIELTGCTESPSKSFVIKITDQNLISKTGGIIQGMSGTPVIQDNMLAGAITHVFVNDPTRGYGILAENMLSNLNNID